jgi:UDP-glucose 4-epimerase
MNCLDRILVTGGAGFIGSHVVDSLVSSGFTVRVIDNLSTGKLANIQNHVRDGRASFVEGDIRDVEVVGKSVHEVDAVVHLAALTSVPLSFESPSLTAQTNAFGTLNLLNACSKEDVRKFVFISSCSVYGDPCYLPIDERHRTLPASPYATSKLEAERYCRTFQKNANLKTVVLRLFNVYGPRQQSSSYSGVIAQFAERIRRGLPLVIYGDGSQTRDFVHVSDVVDAVHRALKDDDSDGQVLNIGFGKATSVNDLAKTFSKLAGSDLDVKYDKPRPGDIKGSFADISKAEKVLGYKPKVQLEAGLQFTLNEVDERIE